MHSQICGTNRRVRWCGNWAASWRLTRPPPRCSRALREKRARAGQPHLGVIREARPAHDRTSSAKVQVAPIFSRETISLLLWRQEDTETVRDSVHTRHQREPPRTNASRRPSRQRATLELRSA
ncbi:hypothetical protein HPB50_004597 [Hyalomma asiaticum]|uniref:Uncharacterized protein n=1 Tax=Hyalomma asiaticum TaxID=266040 RepID=A0ACB7TD22_HYAAI|nr:hypothetical protein HPB50_004597 [Hyalomma asiaticum]